MKILTWAAALIIASGFMSVLTGGLAERAYGLSADNIYNSGNVKGSGNYRAGPDLTNSGNFDNTNGSNSSSNASFSANNARGFQRVVVARSPIRVTGKCRRWVRVKLKVRCVDRRGRIEVRRP